MDNAKGISKLAEEAEGRKRGRSVGISKDLANVEKENYSVGGVLRLSGVLVRRAICTDSEQYSYAVLDTAIAMHAVCNCKSYYKESMTEMFFVVSEM